MTEALYSGTFDVQNITVSHLLTGAVCFTVHYIRGYTTNASFVKLTCSVSQVCLLQAIEERNCFVNLPPCSYTLSATDVGALDSIDTMPAVSIEEIILQGVVSTCAIYTISENVTAMTTMSGAPRGIIYI